MPEIDNTIALQYKPDTSALDPIKTLAQLQMAQAHSALYGAQAQFQNMRLNALQSGDINQLAAVDPELAKKATEFRQGLINDRMTNGSRSATAFLADQTEDGRRRALALGYDAGLFNDPATGQPNLLRLKQLQDIPLPEFAARARQMVAAHANWKEFMETSGGTAGAKKAAELPYETQPVSPGQRVVPKSDVFGGAPPSGPQGAPAAPIPQRITSTLDGFMTSQTNTPEDIVNRWPGMLQGRNTASIVNYLARELGTGPNTPINLNNPQIRGKVSAAMQRWEASGVTPGPLPPEQPATFIDRFNAANRTVAQNRGVSGMNPEEEAYSKGLAEVLPKLATSAENARQQNFTLDSMRRESQSWRMGKWSDVENSAKQYMKSIANGLGYDSTPWDAKIADFESFKKNAGTLTRQAVRETSPRAAAQEFILIQSQLPSADMSKGGFEQIATQFQAVNDYQIAKHQAGQAWRDQHKTMDGFDASWNRAVTPSAFLVNRLAQTNPTELRSLKANLEQTADGRAALASITQQVRWAHQYGLDQLVR
jgi:hypothetical protein